MSREALKKHLKDNQIGKVYLLTGPEQYLIQHYLREIINRVLDENMKTFNYTLFEGKLSWDVLNDTLSMLPVFAERRVVVVRETSLIKESGTGHSWSQFFESLPEYICLIFVQAEIDKRTSFAKTVGRYGLMVECKKQNENALAKWAAQVFHAYYQKQIDMATAAYFVTLPEADMNLMLLEIQKVAKYMGDETRVRREHILAVVSKSIKSRIFDLMDAISQRRTETALRIIDDLIQLREPAYYIMAMISRQVGLLIKMKKMAEGRVKPGEMAKMMGVPSFVVNKLKRQASSFTMERLKQMMHQCMETDLALKTGKSEDRMALELLVVYFDQKSAVKPVRMIQ